MKNVTQSPVVRLTHDQHKQAKICAAIEGVSLSGFVGQALERELARRQAAERRRMAKTSDTIAAAMAGTPPMQVR